MKELDFAPGFRFSVVDGFVLIGAATAGVVLSMFVWWWGFGLAFLLGHFFLFCNVVRMSRSLELLWGSVFVVLVGATIVWDAPGWMVTTLASLLVTLVVVVVEMNKPSYHGLGWQWINPGLPAWWESHIAERSGG